MSRPSTAECGEQKVAVTASASRSEEISEQDRARVSAQLRVWRERLVDISRANPLLGLNRARTSKLRVLTPSPSELFDALVIDGVPLQMPLVRKHPAPVADEMLALP